MNHDILLGHIQEAAKRAAESLEPCKAGCLRLVVPNVRVIGKARLESLSLLVDRTLQRAKQIVAPVFVSEGVALILLLALL
jgi:predicted neutral ceramidase superfamily lipid hydrolase